MHIGTYTRFSLDYECRAAADERVLIDSKILTLKIIMVYIKLNSHVLRARCDLYTGVEEESCLKYEILTRRKAIGVCLE